MQVSTCIIKCLRASVRWWVTGGSGARPSRAQTRSRVAGFRRDGGQGRPGRVEGAQVLLGAAVVGGQALQQRGASGGGDDAAVGLPQPAGAGVELEHRPAVADLGSRQPLVRHPAGGEGAQVRAGRDGGARWEQIQAAGADHQPLPRLPLQLRPGLVGEARQAHVGEVW
jgi:hypothetical protein